MSKQFDAVKFDKNFWNNRYLNNETGWDIGYVSTPLKTYIDQLQNKNIKILIPGGGNSYESEYLYNNGFKNVYVVDISEKALQNFKERVPDFPTTQLLHKDFFTIDTTFDLIFEQTFFCALHPKLRKQYALKMYELLVENGKLVGVLFNFPLPKKEPPFGGDIDEYRTLFSSHFIIESLELCYNSIPKRSGREFFIKLVKPKQTI